MEKGETTTNFSFCFSMTEGLEKRGAVEPLGIRAASDYIRISNDYTVA
jgi:hypothetical protein